MPIYAYKCDSCGYAKDVLQKMSDATLVDCPQCAAPAFKKQLTAAGFQLKGSGWYVTDFKGGTQSGEPAKEGKEGKDGKDGNAEKSPKSGDAVVPAAAPVAATASTASAPAPSPAPTSTPAPAVAKGSV